MTISKDQNEVQACAMTAIFVPYSGNDKCLRCIFSIYDNGTCGSVPCTAEERKDGLTGYFRQSNVQIIEYPCKINNTL